MGHAWLLSKWGHTARSAWEISEERRRCRGYTLEAGWRRWLNGPQPQCPLQGHIWAVFRSLGWEGIWLSLELSGWVKGSSSNLLTLRVPSSLCTGRWVSRKMCLGTPHRLLYGWWQKHYLHGARVYLSWLRVHLRLRSWSCGLWVQASRWALCGQLRAWSLLRILCLLLSLPLSHLNSVSVSQ